jgi:hypothetical protein
VEEVLAVLAEQRSVTDLSISGVGTDFVQVVFLSGCLSVLLAAAAGLRDHDVLRLARAASSRCVSLRC